MSEKTLFLWWMPGGKPGLLQKYADFFEFVFPVLIEEAALSQMLSLSAPDTEVQCLCDCLWAPLPASASRSLLLATNFLSWSASPEQPAPPALQICQVLSREGLPALYDL